MPEKQKEKYPVELTETLAKVREVRREISRDFGDSPTIQESAEEGFSRVEREISLSMRNYILGDRKKAEKYLVEARNLLEKTRLLTWKKKATYAQELTNRNIDGFVKRTADLDLFHRVDVFNETISSAKEMETNEAIETYKKALSMKKNLWRDIDLIKKKSAFEYFYRIALPMVIASMTAGITIYYFTRRIELVVLVIFSSLVIAIGLFSFIKGKIGKEVIALLFCGFVVIWFGANVLGVDLRSIIFSSSLSLMIGVLSSIASMFLSLRRGTKKPVKD